MIAGIYTILANALESGALKKSQAIEIVGHLDKLKPLFDDPPANFVYNLATLHSGLEVAKLSESLEDQYRPIVDELQQYLHSMAFSPPPEMQIDPAQIAADLADLAAFVNEF